MEDTTVSEIIDIIPLISTGILTKIENFCSDLNLFNENFCNLSNKESMYKYMLVYNFLE